MIAPVILALAAVPPPSLERLAAALRGAPAWHAAFVQTYTPEGFDQGTSDKGSLTLVPPDELRFDYASPGERVFAVDGAVARLVDRKRGSCEAVRLDRGTWARLPLAAVLDPGAAAHAFTIESTGDGLRLIPHEPGPDLAEITVMLDGAGLPATVAVKDGAGNINQFEFTHWRTEKLPPNTLFRPALPGSPPCLPED
jgi:outer membrane lipoprotein-sorting protein